MSNNKILSSLFEQVTGQQPAQIAAMPSSGSNRLYFRLYPSTGARTMIGVIGTCREENDAFIYLADHFNSKGLPCARVKQGPGSNALIPMPPRPQNGQLPIIARKHGPPCGGVRT